MAQPNPPTSPQPQPQPQHIPTPHVSKAQHPTEHVLPSEPVSPVSATSPLTALPGTATASTAPGPSPATIPARLVSANTQRPHAASHRHTSEKKYQILRTFASPSTHEAGDYSGLPVPDTTREYDRKTQRWRLWNLVWLEWVITGALCLALWGALFAYSRPYIEMNGGLSIQEKRIFNALTTGLSIALGLNLAGSLRSYIKILRWRLLATQYRSLTDFELVLGLDRQINVLKLIWRVRNRRCRFLPSITQLLCILWIAINLAAAILVAMLGLTYNINQSTKYVSISNGAVSVVDFSQLNATFLAEIDSISFLGQVGSSYYRQLGSLDHAGGGPASYENIGGHSRYWFSDYDPSDFAVGDITDRYVDVIVTCVAYPVTAGVFGNESSVAYTIDGRSIRQNIPEAGQPGPGGLLFIGNTAQTCGPRCTNVKAFQALADPDELDTYLSDATKAQFFVCNSTVSQVSNIPSESYKKYLMSDEIAREFAGAIGWSGQPVPGDSEQYQAYSVTDSLTNGVYSTASADDMAQVVSQYSIGAVAAMDDVNDGSVTRQIIQGGSPGSANYLQVVWWHAGPILVGIPLLQLVSLLAVIAIGNRAVIKDDSYLAIAELYKSTVDRLGNHGSILRGEEIIDALKDPADGHEPKVIYAWKNIGDDDHGQLRHVDVYDDKSNVNVQPNFIPGRYD